MATVLANSWRVQGWNLDFGAGMGFEPRLVAFKKDPIESLHEFLRRTLYNPYIILIEDPTESYTIPLKGVLTLAHVRSSENIQPSTVLMPVKADGHATRDDPWKSLLRNLWSHPA